MGICSYNEKLLKQQIELLVEESKNYLPGTNELSNNSHAVVAISKQLTYNRFWCLLLCFMGYLFIYLMIFIVKLCRNKR